MVPLYIGTPKNHSVRCVQFFPDFRDIIILDWAVSFFMIQALVVAALTRKDFEVCRLNEFCIKSFTLQSLQGQIWQICSVSINSGTAEHTLDLHFFLFGDSGTNVAYMQEV
jgi:hypothetical protein